MRHLKPIGIFVTIVVNCFIVSACVFAPAIGSIKQAGVVESDRQELLAKEVKHYSDILSMGRPNDALVFVAADQVPTLGSELRKAMRQEKIVESAIDDVTFTNDSYDAEVMMRVKYYKVPVYIVDERMEKQHWTFSLASGWKMQAREKIESKG